MSSARVLIVHESMFGNTLAIAEVIAATLQRRGLTVAHTDVRKTPIRAVNQHDLIVLGAPTHAFSLSRPATRADAIKQGAVGAPDDIGIREWIVGLPDASTAASTASGTPARPQFAVFDTRVSAVRRLPAAAHKATRMLRHKGYQMLCPPVGFCVSDTKGPIAPGVLAHATAWGNTLADQLRFQSARVE